jgi:hypothetical protein
MDVRRCVVRGVRAAQQIHRMFKELLEHGEAFFHTVRRAWEIDD